MFYTGAYTVLSLIYILYILVLPLSAINQTEFDDTDELEIW